MVVSRATTIAEKERRKGATSMWTANFMVSVRSLYLTPTPEEFMKATLGQVILSGRRFGLLDEEI